MSNAGDGDKRTVATDALLTLGTIIGPAEKRDAIHLAVEPVIAGEKLRPGDHVVVDSGLAVLVDPGKLVGVADGVETFEEAFLAHIVTSEGPTVMEAMQTLQRGGEGPLLLAAVK